MNYKQRTFAVMEMANYDDKDAWLSDVALSSIWGDDEEDVPQELIDELSKLWLVCHVPFRSLVAPRSIKEISDRFCIPYRTVQNWYDGNRECAKWVRLFIHDALKDSGE